MKRVRPTVLVIGPTPPPFHGVAVATQNLLSAADDDRVQLCHLDIADRRGIEHVDKPDWFDVVLFCRQWLKLAGILIGRRPQVAYLSISQTTIGFLRDSLFIALVGLFRRRLVIHLHGGNFRHWYDSRSLSMRALIRAVLSCSTKFIILAESFRDSLSGIVAAHKVIVVPNGIPWRKGAEEIRRTAPERGYRVLFLSTLSREKGALLLIESAAQVVRRRRDVEFVLAGPWLREVDRTAAMRLVEKHALEGKVVFPGQVAGAAKFELYDSASLFVFPGIQQEGQPLVVLEAMASSLPVVFPNRGCLTDTVVDGQSGLEFNINDATDLSRKLLWLLERPEEMKRMGANAHRRYEELYSEQRFISNMKQVFLSAAGATG